MARWSFFLQWRYYYNPWNIRRDWMKALTVSGRERGGRTQRIQNWQNLMTTLMGRCRILPRIEISHLGWLKGWWFCNWDSKLLGPTGLGEQERNIFLFVWFILILKRLLYLRLGGKKNTYYSSCFKDTTGSVISWVVIDPVSKGLKDWSEVSPPEVSLFLELIFPMNLLLWIAP